jgi:predicted phage terminase large subunit-like protein
MSTNPQTICGYPKNVVIRAFEKANGDQKERMFRLIEGLKICPRQQIKSITAEEKLKLETNLSHFCREAWKTVYPLTNLVWSWHYDLISEYLQLVRARQLQRVIFNVPPRSLKTWQISVFFPVWCWITDPAHSFLCGSYSHDLSTEHSILRRNLITGQWFQGLWGDRFQLSQDRNLTTQFSNTKGGQMIATSTGSGAEGRGGDTAILDDPMSSKQALSDVERNSANEWVTTTLLQRLNNPRTGAIILIMQRLHEMDTTGYVMAKNPGEWTQVVIPLEQEDRKEFTFPVSKKVKVREKGDVLQPERFTAKVVEQKKTNRLVYAGQYQQRPAPLEGNLIKRSEVRYHSGVDPVSRAEDEKLPEMRKFSRVLISVDANFKDPEEWRRKNPSGDVDELSYVAIAVIGVHGRKRMILDLVNEHLDIAATEAAILRKREQWRAMSTLVEGKANGPAIIQRLKNQIPGVIEIEPEGSKIARMFAAAPEWQAGDWYVDRNAAWAEPFVQQIIMFPTASHDDMADAMTQAAIWLQKNSGVEVWGRL